MRPLVYSLCVVSSPLALSRGVCGARIAGAA